MGLKLLLSTAEVKQLHVQFDCVLSTFMDNVWFTVDAIISCVHTSEEGRVYWDRSIANLKNWTQLTKDLQDDIPGVVAMIDGNKLISFESSNYILQNRDYNGWTKDVNQNLVLVWDMFGKIVDTAVNVPGSFHNSKSTLWGRKYEHIAHLPDRYKCCCDDAFCTKGKLENKLVKQGENIEKGMSGTNMINS